MSFPKISFKRVSLKNFAEFIKNSYVRVFYSFSFTKTKDSGVFTVQKIKFSIKDFFSKCDQIRSFLRTWSHLLKKSLMENFTFCAVFLANFAIFFQNNWSRTRAWLHFAYYITVITTQNIAFKIYLECCYMQHCSSFNIPFSLMWPIVILPSWKHHNWFTSHTQHCIMLFNFRKLTNTVVCVNFYYGYMNHKDH